MYRLFHTLSGRRRGGRPSIEALVVGQVRPSVVISPLLSLFLRPTVVDLTAAHVPLVLEIALHVLILSHRSGRSLENLGGLDAQRTLRPSFLPCAGVVGDLSRRLLGGVEGVRGGGRLARAPQLIEVGGNHGSAGLMLMPGCCLGRTEITALFTHVRQVGLA